MTAHFIMKSGEILSIQGQADVLVKSGSILAVGAHLQSGSRFTIQKGKKIPVEARGDTELLIDDGAKYEAMQTSPIPNDWEELVKQIINHKSKVVLILGEMDTGKSFLSTYLANRLLTEGRASAVVDCDLGQSDIGPPCAMGVALIDKPVVFLHQVKPKEVYFVGAHSPSLHMVEFLNGIQRLVRNAGQYADTVIINTTGWIHADGGRLLKLAKLRMLVPDLVVMLQRGDELHYVEKMIRLPNVFSLKVSHEAHITPKSDRKLLREFASMAYFNNSVLVDIPFEQFVVEGAYFKTGEELKPIPELGVLWVERIYELRSLYVITERKLTDAELAAIKDHYKFPVKLAVDLNLLRGLMIGMLDAKRNCLGLGIIRKIDLTQRKLIVRAPCQAASEAVSIRFGSVRYYADGRELGYISPGSV